VAFWGALAWGQSWNFLPGQGALQILNNEWF
jgi:hypothetical protein